MVMIKTLVSLNADLASSIAFRYSCRLTQFVDMSLQTIHVEEVGGYPPGSGWVRSTWEKGSLHTAQEEISQLINAERSSWPPLGPPIIRVGEREDELIHEIEDQSYDLFMEGILNSFSPVNFYKKLRSKLYRYAPCPIILVKNLVDPNGVALLLTDNADLRPLISTFLKIFRKSELKVDLIHFTFQKSWRPGFREKVGVSSIPGHENANKMLGEARAMLTEKGWDRRESWIIQDTLEKFNEFLEDCSLVAACIPRNPARKSWMMELLSRVPTATLLCRK
jgi:hypothetical protein